MPKLRFTTVGDDLLLVAEATHTWLATQGFKVSIEKSEIEFPRLPTFVATRGHSTLFVEVALKLDQTTSAQWLRYGRSCDTDTQAMYAVPNKPGPSQFELEYCTKNKLGLLTVDDRGIATEIVSSADLAMNVELPPLDTLPVRVRRLIAPAYRKIERGDWRDGLAEGCLAVEDLARKYLKWRSTKPGVSILDTRGRVLQLPARQIDKSTLGQLGGFFLGITTPNALDSLLAKTLPTINPERIGAVHKKYSAKTETKLRRLAGKRMYAVVNCLRELTRTR